MAALVAGPVYAHFQVLIPSKDVVEASDGRSVELTMVFTHPMQQGPAMEMGRPKQAGVLVGGKRYDLLPMLETRSVDGATAFAATARLIRPGDHVFYLAPAPYWEPAERKMIIHYTKVVVDFMGAEEGWDASIGFPVEIEPLVRPYGLWTGNTFRGIVKHGGKPVPHAEVEVEYYNQAGVVPPNDAFITQVIKADASGMFSYSMPKAGWWGFAALVDGEPMPNPDGEMVEVELGGLIWVKTVDME
jgi:cobalt/nickel transport protein